MLTELVTDYMGMRPEFLLREVRNPVDDNNKFGLPFWAAADSTGGKFVVTRSVGAGDTVQAASAATKADPLTNDEFTAAKKRLLGTRSSRWCWFFAFHAADRPSSWKGESLLGTRRPSDLAIDLSVEKRKIRRVVEERHSTRQKNSP